MDSGMEGQTALSRVRDCRITLLGSLNIHNTSSYSIVDLAFI